MMDEYVRLTNLAFGVNCVSPPVFLLDETQELLQSSQCSRMAKLCIIRFYRCCSFSWLGQFAYVLG